MNESTEGQFIVNESTVECFSATQKRIGRERVALDFEHNTVKGTPEYERTSEPRLIAAMGTPVVVSGDGIFLESLSYTDTGKAHARDYEDISPAPLVNAAGVVVGLHSAGLTRTGALYGANFTAAEGVKALASGLAVALAGEGIRVVSLRAGASLQTLSAPVGADVSNNEKVTKMPDTITLEGLAAKLDEALKSFGDRIAALEKDGCAPDVTALSARMDKHEKNLLDEQRARIVPLFAQEGRVPQNPATGKAYTADELAALDLPTLRVLHANTPQTVPLTARAGNPRVLSASTSSAREAISAATDTILNRDKCGRDEAFRRARKERPDLFPA